MNRDALTLLARAIRDKSRVTLTIRYDGDEADMKACVTCIQVLDLNSYDKTEQGVDEVTFKACI